MKTARSPRPARATTTVNEIADEDDTDEESVGCTMPAGEGNS
jgi:hypothetical protein